MWGRKWLSVSCVQFGIFVHLNHVGVEYGNILCDFIFCSFLYILAIVFIDFASANNLLSCLDKNQNDFHSTVIYSFIQESK